MTPADALRQATKESKRLTYDDVALKEILARVRPDTWKTPDELTREGRGLCRDFAIWTCWRTWQLCGGIPDPGELVMVIGHTDPAAETAGAWHAWVELVTPEREPLWAEPTPGYRDHVDTPDWFAERVPRFAQRFDGEVFDQEYEYRRVA